jgi:hypothetical protein
VSKHKQSWISEYLKGNYDSKLALLIEECKIHPAVRLSGTGDILKEHIPNILKLARACPSTIFWGMTRKLEIAIALNNKLPNLKLMVSVDSSSPESVWNYQGTLCWGPRLATDIVPADPRIRTVFPYHSSGKIVQAKSMPKDKRDCPAIRHTLNGCMECGHCWTW